MRWGIRSGRLVMVRFLFPSASRLKILKTKIGADEIELIGARSFLPTLSTLVQSGLTTLIWAGDADSVCDWFGGFASVNAIEYDSSDEFRETEVSNYTVKGTVKGIFALFVTPFPFLNCFLPSLVPQRSMVRALMW
jgi:hypothetical protein